MAYVNSANDVEERDTVALTVKDVRYDEQEPSDYERPMHKALKDTYSAVKLLRESGTPIQLIQLAVPTMFWTPAESDPDAQTTHVINHAAQRRLKSLGFQVRETGTMDPHTQAALANIGGKEWASKAWITLFHIMKRKKDRDMGYLGLSGGFGALGAAGTPTDVKALQKMLGVTADGVVGPKTTAAVLAVLRQIRPRLDADDGETADIVLLNPTVSMVKASVVELNQLISKAQMQGAKITTVAKAAAAKTPAAKAGPGVQQLPNGGPAKAGFSFGQIFSYSIAGVPVVPVLGLAAGIYFLTRPGLSPVRQNPRQRRQRR
jgi:peptidoglycan hydrolase-like protein with peptidoglycan-binding domain